MNTQTKYETATLGGGCFWCLEAVYQELKGVQKVVSGYAGGEVDNPTYDEVCSGNTGHAEVVQITYDPEIITFKELLEVFFTIHNPTTINRQGADVGTQYRSIILYHSDEQLDTAEISIEEVEEKKIWNCGIVTQLVPLKQFYPAEDYHQDYYKNNRNQPYCRVVIDPKVSKFRKEYVDKLKTTKLKL